MMRGIHAKLAEQNKPQGRSAMHVVFGVALSGAVALSGVMSLALAQGTDGHTMLAPHEIKWAAAPPSIPPGAEAAVLYGDPSKDGMFAMRLKFPKG